MVKKKSYVGQTDDLNRRLTEHNKGQVSSSKPFIPYRLIHYEVYYLKSEALVREKFLKTGKGREELKGIFRSKDI